MRRIREQLTFANVVAAICLFVVLGGTSVAQDVTESAARLITGRQVKNESLTGADIKDRSLTEKDFRTAPRVSADAVPGPTGPQGPAGSTGPAGETGARGEPGAKGETGARGETGPKGETGARGETGAKGETGARGETGPKGETGGQGVPGPKGDKGDDGQDGEDGAPGQDGEDGAPGHDGSPDTPAQVLDKLKTVDGDGSGIDADRIDNVDSADLQRRGNETTCPAGQKATALGVSGNLSCAADADTTYTAGSGLLLSGGAFSTNFGTTAGTVTQGNDPRLSDSRPPTGDAGGDLTGTYPSPQIGTGSVGMAEMAPLIGTSTGRNGFWNPGNTSQRVMATGTVSPTANGSCYVTVSMQFETRIAFDNDDVLMEIATNINGNPFPDSGYPRLVPATAAFNWTAPVTITSVVNVVGGLTYTFGAHLTIPAGNSGNDAVADVSWLCV